MENDLKDKLLPYKFRVYVPHSKLVDSFMRDLTLIAGGCTVLHGSGKYRMSRGECKAEVVSIVEVFCDDDTSGAVAGCIHDEVRRLHATGEESVLVEAASVESGSMGALYTP